MRIEIGIDGAVVGQIEIEIVGVTGIEIGIDGQKGIDGGIGIGTGGELAVDGVIDDRILEEIWKSSNSIQEVLDSI